MVQSMCDAHTGKEMKIRGDMTEVVDEFVHLGTCITKRKRWTNRYEEEGRTGQQRILSAASNEGKIILYKTIIRSVLWYGSKVQSWLQTAEKVLNEFQRKVLWKIYGPVLINGQWQNMHNQEIYKLYKEMELTRNMWLRRLQRVGQVMRMDEKGAQEGTERTHTREKTSWKAQREMNFMFCWLCILVPLWVNDQLDAQLRYIIHLLL